MKRFLITPFLFTLASLLQLNYIASIVVSPDQIFRPLIVLWLLLAILIAPAYWLTRDWNWAALLLTAFVLGFYFSASFFSVVLICLLFAGICWLAFVRLRRVKIRLTNFLYILMGTSLFFSVYALFLQSTMLARIPWKGYRQAIADARNDAIPPPSSAAAKPDIYYIVLDGYARSDILQEIFQFDNTGFIASLEERGFIVPDSMHSNYPATPLSIASTLNMEYIQQLIPVLHRSPHRWLMAPFIDHSRVRAFLESQGYQTVSMSTNWTITDNGTTDHYLQPFPVMLTDFESFVLDLTPLQLFAPLLKGFASLPTPESHRQVIRFNFETLTTLPKMPGPKFVFAHIISPHPPFVFDKDGEPLDPRIEFSFQDASEFPGSLEEYRQNYVGQVEFVNDNLLKTIDAILAQSETPPIIILQADHGSGMFTDLGSSEKTCIRERFSPFSAYFLPEAEGILIPPDTSTVNLFRIVLNDYFDTQLPLLENRQYFYQDMQAYYDFKDVTQRLNDACAIR